MIAANRRATTKTAIYTMNPNTIEEEKEEDIEEFLNNSNDLLQKLNSSNDLLQKCTSPLEGTVSTTSSSSTTQSSSFSKTRTTRRGSSLSSSSSSSSTSSTYDDDDDNNNKNDNRMSMMKQQQNEERGRSLRTFRTATTASESYFTSFATLTTNHSSTRRSSSGSRRSSYGTLRSSFSSNSNYNNDFSSGAFSTSTSSSGASSYLEFLKMQERTRSLSFSFVNIDNENNNNNCNTAASTNDSVEIVHHSSTTTTTAMKQQRFNNNNNSFLRRSREILLYEREMESAALHNFLDQMLLFDDKNNATTKGFFVVKGNSGVGKTSFVNYILKAHMEKKISSNDRRIRVITGKCDSNHQNRPYGAISALCSNVCRQIIMTTNNSTRTTRRRRGREGEASYLELPIIIRRAILSQLKKPEIYLLTDLIPDLELITGYNNHRYHHLLKATTTIGNNSSSNNYQKLRFKYVFRILLRIFSTYLSPFIMFLDDLQWADKASLEVIEEELTDVRNPKHVIIVGCYNTNNINYGVNREGSNKKKNRKASSQADNDLQLPLPTMIQRLKGKSDTSFSFQMEEIELQHLKPYDIQKIIRALLGIQDDNGIISMNNEVASRGGSVRDLAMICYEATSGNHFFVLQFINMLKEEGLLQFNPNNFRWTWDIKEIEREITDDDDVMMTGIELLKREMKSLPEQAQELLKYISYLGPTLFNKRIIELLLEKKHQHHNDDAVIVSPSRRRSFLMHNKRKGQNRSCSSLQPSADSNHTACTEYLSLLVERNILEKTGTRNANSYYTTTASLLSSSSYQWVHDMMQDAARLLIQGKANADDHASSSLPYNIGVTLLQNLQERELETFLFEIVDLLNRGDIRHRHREGIKTTMRLAELNLRAAKKAYDMSALEIAAQYLSKGICLLPKKRTKNYYFNVGNDDTNNDGSNANHGNNSNHHLLVALNLYSLGIKIESSLGNKRRVKYYCNAILMDQKKDKISSQSCRSMLLMMEKLKTYILLVDFYSNAGKMKKAITICCSVLKKQLDYPVPSRFFLSTKGRGSGCLLMTGYYYFIMQSSSSLKNFAINIAQKIISSLQSSSVLNNKRKSEEPFDDENDDDDNSERTMMVMDDPKILATIHLLSKLSLMAYQSNNTYLWLATLQRRVMLTLQYGICPETPAIISQLSVILSDVFNERWLGFRLAQQQYTVAEVLLSAKENRKALSFLYEAVTFPILLMPLQSYHRNEFELVSLSNNDNNITCTNNNEIEIDESLELTSTTRTATTIKCDMAFNYGERDICKLHSLFLRGKALGEIETDLKMIDIQMIGNNNICFRPLMNIYWQAILNLKSNNSTTTRLDGERMKETEIIRITHKSYLRYMKSLLCTYFGEYELGSKLALRCCSRRKRRRRKNNNRFGRTASLPDGGPKFISDLFYQAMSLYAMARQQQEQQLIPNSNKRRRKRLQLKYYKEAKLLHEIINTWQITLLEERDGDNTSCPIDYYHYYQHYVLLLDAEEAAALDDHNDNDKNDGDDDDEETQQQNNDTYINQKYYESALIAARQGYYNDAGLANERYADFLLLKNKKKKKDSQQQYSKHYQSEGKFRLREAIRFYSKWGAERKVKMLRVKLASI